MTKPQEPKRVHIDSICAGIPSGEFMLAEEALAYAEAVRQEALDEAAQVSKAALYESRNVFGPFEYEAHCNEIDKQIRKLKGGK